MVEFVLTSAVIFVVLVGWLYVQDLYRRFAQRNPDLGPFRGEGGCGGSCSCHQGTCRSPEPIQESPVIAVDLITITSDHTQIQES